MAKTRRDFNRDNQRKYNLNNNYNYNDNFEPYKTDYEPYEETDINYLDVYNEEYEIRVQDAYIQQLPSPQSFVSAKRLDKVTIDNIKTEFYDNGYAYHYYYDWIDLHTTENAKNTM